MSNQTPWRAYKKKIDSTKGRVDINGDPIEFLLTFDEWSRLWEASGHFGEWGHHKGEYCLSRYDDVGHYEVGNVFIQLHSENTAEMNRRRLGRQHPNYGKKICPQTHESRIAAAAKGVITRNANRIARKAAKHEA